MLPGRTIVAIVAALLLGSGVAWAATGEFPGKLVFGHELGEGLSTGEQDEASEGFSVLGPAESTEDIPDETLRLLQFMRLKPGPPPSGPGPTPENFKPETVLESADITAIGHARTDPGGRVSIFVMDGKICYFWIDLRGGNCGTPAEARRGRLFTTGRIHDGSRGAIGVVDDRVKTIRVEGTSIPAEPVIDNVFDITGLPDRPVVFISLDESGHEVHRVKVG